MGAVVWWTLRGQRHDSRPNLTESGASKRVSVATEPKEEGLPGRCGVAEVRAVVGRRDGQAEVWAVLVVLGGGGNKQQSGCGNGCLFGVNCTPLYRRVGLDTARRLHNSHRVRGSAALGYQTGRVTVPGGWYHRIIDRRALASAHDLAGASIGPPWSRHQRSSRSEMSRPRCNRWLGQQSVVRRPTVAQRGWQLEDGCHWRLPIDPLPPKGDGSWKTATIGCLGVVR